jgi:NTP pyrophosphatase (non-canonical NTP hydrolase)
MDIQEHTKGVMRSVKRLRELGLDNLHMILGITTEAGELADVFKKFLAYNKEIDWVNIQEEIGDILFYIFAFCSMNNLDFEKICEANLSKLRIRYPEKYTDSNANNRNLEKERKLLEELGYHQK